VNLANGGDWARALGPATQAADDDPAISPYQFTAGLAEAWAGNHDAAVARLKIVAERDDFPEAWLGPPPEQAALRPEGVAPASLGSAVRVGFQRPAISMPAGDLALRLGDKDMAVEAFADALSVTPSLAGDSWWTSDPARAAVWPDTLRQASAKIAIEDTAGSFAPPTLWELALMHGDADLAR